MDDRIEERVTIRATRDTVWHLVARPGWWLPGSRATPAREPGRVAVTYRGDARPYMIDIVRLEPQGYAAFRWASAFSGTVPVPGNATLVECYLRPAGQELSVTVVESGFASLDLPEDLRENERKGNKGGWRYELAGLRTRAEAELLSLRGALRRRGTVPPHPVGGRRGRPGGMDMADVSADPDRVFAALADARRRELLQLLADAAEASAGGLAAALPVSRQAVAQHLAVLEEARLVTRRRSGRQVLFTVRPEGLAATADWLVARAVAWRSSSREPFLPASSAEALADQGKDT